VFVCVCVRARARVCVEAALSNRYGNRVVMGRG